MSFAFEIKKELMSKEFSKENSLAFFAGLIEISGVKNNENILIKINNFENSQNIRNLINDLNINWELSKENKNYIVLNNYKIESHVIKNPSQFFAGIFVGGGSISDIESTSYHLELQFNSHQSAVKIQSFLNKYSFKFSLIQRRHQFVLYLKKSEHISDFLRAIEAFNSLMTFENKRIERDFKNQLNRYSNLDSYNQEKLAYSTLSFLENYDVIKKNKKELLFSESEIQFYNLKKQNPYSSLSELINLFNKKYKLNKTKSCANHWLIKLRNISDNLRNI